jgi:hypothetical protein
MPSTSKKQHNFMEAIAHSEKFAKKVGVPMSVGKDFAEADKGRKFRKGGTTSPTEQGINKQKTHHGSMQMPNAMLNQYIGKREGGMAKSDMKEDMKADIKQDKAIVKKAFGMHDKQLHESKRTNLTKLKGGGMAKMKETMGPRTMSMDVEKGSNKLTKFGESAVQKRGHTKGINLGDSGPTVSPKTVKMAKGGMCMGGKSTKKMSSGGTASKRADGIASKGKTKGKWC